MRPATPFLHRQRRPTGTDAEEYFKVFLVDVDDDFTPDREGALVAANRERLFAGALGDWFGDRSTWPPLDDEILVPGSR